MLLGGRGEAKATSRGLGLGPISARDERFGRGQPQLELELLKGRFLRKLFILSEQLTHRAVEAPQGHPPPEPQWRREKKRHVQPKVHPKTRQRPTQRTSVLKLKKNSPSGRNCIKVDPGLSHCGKGNGVLGGSSH